MSTPFRCNLIDWSLQRARGYVEDVGHAISGLAQASADNDIVYSFESPNCWVFVSTDNELVVFARDPANTTPMAAYRIQVPYAGISSFIEIAVVEQSFVVLEDRSTTRWVLLLCKHLTDRPTTTAKGNILADHYETYVAFKIELNDESRSGWIRFDLGRNWSDLVPSLPEPDDVFRPILWTPGMRGPVMPYNRSVVRESLERNLNI